MHKWSERSQKTENDYGWNDSLFNGREFKFLKKSDVNTLKVITSTVFHKSLANVRKARMNIFLAFKQRYFYFTSEIRVVSFKTSHEIPVKHLFMTEIHSNSM